MESADYAAVAAAASLDCEAAKARGVSDEDFFNEIRALYQSIFASVQQTEAFLDLNPVFAYGLNRMAKAQTVSPQAFSSLSKAFKSAPQWAALLKAQFKFSHTVEAIASTFLDRGASVGANDLAIITRALGEDIAIFELETQKEDFTERMLQDYQQHFQACSVFLASVFGGASDDRAWQFFVSSYNAMIADEQITSERFFKLSNALRALAT